MKGLQLILTIMCSDKEAARLERLINKEHTRRFNEATRAMQQEYRKNGHNVLKAAKKIFHAKCNAKTCKSDEFEREVIEAMETKEELKGPLTWPVKKLSSFDFDATLERSLRKELDRVLVIRNGAAYQLIQQHFARAHAKRVVLGDESLDVAERLLCDYASVEQLKISSDPTLLFFRVAQWLRTRLPDRCRACGKQASIKCQQCGKRCFCSIPCQVQDESNRVFCHAHECGILLDN